MGGRHEGMRGVGWWYRVGRVSDKMVGKSRFCERSGVVLTMTGIISCLEGSSKPPLRLGSWRVVFFNCV